MKILITEPLDQTIVRRFQNQYPGIIFQSAVNFPGQDLPVQIKLIKDCQALIIRSETKIIKALVAKATGLKIIASACSGVNNVDLKALKKLGIKHVNSPNGNYEAVAEHILCLMLSLSKNIISADRQLKNHLWRKNKLISEMINGKTLGIVGFGKIGKCLSKKALGLGLKILAHDPFVNLAEYPHIKPATLNTLLKKSDYIAVCVPLLKETVNLINKNKLILMKPSAYLINCSRGEVIDEKALYYCCKNRKISGAGLDVFSNEPNINYDLCELSNVIVTPHIAGQTKEALKKNSEIVLKQVINYLL
jgi:D-3-phosphoglycerate dehydrogenase